MFYRAAGLLASLAISGNAFLIPAGLSGSNSDARLSTFVNPKAQAIKIPCPGCVFPSKGEDSSVEFHEEDDLFWAQGGARDLILDFTVSDDSRAVLINGFQIYPITLHTSDHPTVGEVAASTSLAEVKEHPEELTTLEVTAAGIAVEAEVVSETGDKIVTVNYQVLSLEGQSMAVDGAEVKLLEGGDGSLMIISVQGVPMAHDVFDGLDFQPPPPRPVKGDGKDCSMLPAALCSFKGMIESKIESLKHGIPANFHSEGCGGRKGPHGLPGHIKPHFDHFEDSEDDKTEDEEHKHHQHHGHPPRPHPHGHHGHHGPPRFMHRFIRAFASVLVPVLAGVTMGMFVSLLGMAAGRLISFLWIKFRRGGHRGYAGLPQTEEQTDSLKKGDMGFTEEEALPIYESAPAYEEKAQQ